MRHLPNVSYRSLELLCRQQAALASTSDTRHELDVEPQEVVPGYGESADWWL